MNLSKIEMMNVVSPDQLTTFAILFHKLSSLGDKPDITIEYAARGLVDPFDVRICLGTLGAEIWLYADGADSSGALEFRYEIEDFSTSAELFAKVTSRVLEFARSVAQS